MESSTRWMRLRPGGSVAVSTRTGRPVLVGLSCLAVCVVVGGCLMSGQKSGELGEVQIAVVQGGDEGGGEPAAPAAQTPREKLDNEGADGDPVAEAVTDSLLNLTGTDELKEGRPTLFVVGIDVSGSTANSVLYPAALAVQRLHQEFLHPGDVLWLFGYANREQPVGILLLTRTEDANKDIERAEMESRVQSWRGRVGRGRGTFVACALKHAADVAAAARGGHDELAELLAGLQGGEANAGAFQSLSPGEYLCAMALIGDGTLGDDASRDKRDCDWDEATNRIEQAFGGRSGTRTLPVSTDRSRDTVTVRMNVSRDLLPASDDGGGETGNDGGGGVVVPPPGGGGAIPPPPRGSVSPLAWLFLLLCVAAGIVCGWCVSRFVLQVKLNASGTDVVVPVPMFGGRSVTVQSGPSDSFDGGAATVVLGPGNTDTAALFALQAKGGTVLISPTGITRLADASGDVISGAKPLSPGEQSVFVERGVGEGQHRVALQVLSVGASNGQQMQWALISGVVALAGLLALIIA